MIPLPFLTRIARHGPAIVVVLLLVGTLGLGTAGWIAANPPTTTVTTETHTATVTSSLSTRTVVTGKTSLYDQGAHLRDQPVYLRSATPNLTLVHTTELPDESVTVLNQHLAVVYTAARDGTVFWTRTDPLRGTTNRRNGTVTTTGSVDVSTVLDTLEQYQAEFGQGATVTVHLNASIAYQSDRYSDTVVTIVPLQAGATWYRVPTDTVSKTHSTPVRKTVALPVTQHVPFIAAVVGGFGAGIGAIVVRGLYLVVFRNTSEQMLTTDIHRRRYNDWISTGSLPDTNAGAIVYLATLEDLVDVAIDSNNRVIHDRDKALYAVVATDVRYHFDPDSPEGISDQSSGPKTL